MSSTIYDLWAYVDNLLRTSSADIVNDLHAATTNLVTLWYQSTETLQGQVFNGSTSSITVLSSFFSDGKLLENGYTPLSSGQIQDVMKKAMYAILIPAAWKLTNGLGVAVIDAQKSCDHSVSNPFSTDDLSDSDATAMGECYNGNLYFLLAAQGDEEHCWVLPDGVTWNCHPNPFSQPPGASTLTGNTWSGLNITDMIQG
jgi:hypothetical protein